MSLSATLLMACAGSPSTPSEISPERIVEGQTVSAVDGTAVGGVSVHVGTAFPVTTDAAGFFTAEVAGRGRYATVISGDGIVERRTSVDSPTPERTRLSLIPASFDLIAFDELCRSANRRLQRWTTRPALVVLAAVMSYRGVATEYAATAEQMSDEEVTQMVSHLTEGLSLLTGGAFTTFASVRVERPAEGERASVARAGTIVVGRYNGVKSLAGTIGYGTWAEEPDGTVSAGASFLDSTFDRESDFRRLLRIHELGHALGYLHVASRMSIMNSAIGPEPTEFDRAAAVIAFQRPPGNVSPDTDPSFGSGTSFGAQRVMRWAPRVP